MTATFYDVLGVAEDATTDEIEAAYRERLKETHPDVSDDADAGRATRRLIEARDVLVDDEERARYDRLGHEAYVGTDGESPMSWESNGTATTDGDETGSAHHDGRDRARRERRARERVRREQARRSRRTKQSQPSEETDSQTAASGSATETTGSASESANKRRQTADASATGSGNTYSVREDVTAPTSRGPLLPTGRERTLFGIFFALYPVLLFSALLPAFPLFVNLLLGACTVLTISYLQSMPRVALWLFGGWSGISVVGLAVLEIGFFSAVGLVVLGGTVLPFGFSLLIAAALRY